MRSDPVRYSRRLADCSLSLGLQLYQQEGDPSEIRNHFARAGQNLLVAFSQKWLDPLELEKALALAVCFCPRSVYEDVDKIPEKNFNDPSAYDNADKSFLAIGGADHLVFFAGLVQYLNLLRHFLASGQLDMVHWKQAEAACLKPGAAPYDAKVNLWKLRGLLAVTTKDATLFNEAMAKIVQDHEHEAQRGENQRSTRGFICLPAMMLAYLGREVELVCEVQSPYLPLHLLKHERRGHPNQKE